MPSKCCLCESNHQCIALWDGKDYCEYCVTSVAPGLYQYAKDYPIFQDDMPLDAEDIRKKWLRSFIICSVAFAIPLLCAGGPLLFRLVFILVIVAFCYFYSRLYYYVHFNRRTSIRISSGEVFLSKGGKPFQFTCKLTEISWRIAPAASTNEFTKLLPKHDVVLISYPYRMPPPLETMMMRREVPCAWTSDKMQILIGFLMLANVPKTVNRTFSEFVSTAYSSLRGTNIDPQK